MVRRKESGLGRGAAGIGLAHGLAEPPNRVGILDAARRLDAGAHVNGPGPDLLNPLNDISGMQPTRQNDRKGNVGGNERPIEDLSATAEPLDFGIEQQGLGAGMLARKV